MILLTRRERTDLIDAVAKPGLLLAALLVGAWTISACSSPPRHSILLIVVDTLRYDAGDPGGPPDAAIPQYLLGRGTHFTNAVAASDWTSPSMVALMTGRYPSDCGLLTATWTTEFPKSWSLADRVRRTGYRTAAVVSNPTLDGVRLGLQAGFDSFDDRMSEVERNREVGRRSAPETTDAALGALSRLAEGRAPWFLWVQYLEPHGPYSAPAPYPQTAKDPGSPIDTAPGDIAGRGLLPRYQYLAEARGRNDYATRYRASAEWSVDEADRFLRTAAAKGYLKNVTVVFTADHGEFLGEDDYWFQHGVHLNPAVVRVPLVIAGSGNEPIRRDSRAVTHLDLVPTLSRILGLPNSPDLAGIDLFDEHAVRKGPIIVQNIAFPENAEIGVILKDRFAIQGTGNQPESFRVDGQSWEPDGTDLTPGEVQAIATEMQRVRKLPVPTRDVPLEEIQKLRALGYLH